MQQDEEVWEMLQKIKQNWYQRPTDPRMSRQFKCPRFTFSVSRLLTVQGCAAWSQSSQGDTGVNPNELRLRVYQILSISVHANVVHESRNGELLRFWPGQFADVFAWVLWPHLPYRVDLTCFQLVSGENNQISRTGPSWCCSGDTCDFEICARTAVETLPLKTVLSCKSW